jgi:hypothetical protein
MELLKDLGGVLSAVAIIILDVGKGLVAVSVIA